MATSLRFPGLLRPARFLLTLLVALAPLACWADVSFAEPRMLPGGYTTTGGSFYGVAVADLDRDGRLDVAATGYGIAPLLWTAEPREFVLVWLGNGDGTFQPPVDLDLGPTDTVGAAGIVAVDLDRDGILDLAIAAFRQQAILVLLGRGDGTFAPATAYDAGAQAGTLQAADLDGDGNPDLAIAPVVGEMSIASTQIAVLRGDGAGGFLAPVLHTVSQFPVDLVIADADGKDGLDILVACNTHDELSVLLNDGHGGFAATATSYPVRVDARGLWAGDFDGDGMLDVLVAGVNGTYVNTCGGGCLVTVHGNGDGTFTAPPPENVRVTGAWPARFYVSGSQGPDLNGDGRPDAFFPRPEGGRVYNELTVALSRPGGGYDLAEWVASPGLPASPDSHVDGAGTFSAAAGDLDGDGAPDLVVASASGAGVGAISVMPGIGGKPGTFRAPRLVSLSRGWSPTRALALGRFTADAALDILATTDALDTVPGSGDGTFGVAFAALARVAGPGEFYQTLRTADLNGDGKLDALWLADDGVQGGPAPRHLVALGGGDGTFGSVQALVPESGFQGVNAVIADLDGNGTPDLSILTFGPGVVHVETWTNDGSATPAFTQKGVAVVQPGPVGLGSQGVAVGDLDHDGRPDLVAHRLNAAGGDDLLFFRGNGDGTFAAPAVVSSDLASTVADIAVADVDEDGDADLLVAPDWSSSVYLLLGHGNGTFAARAPIPSGTGTNEVRAADLDGDGHLDLVVGATNGPAFHRGDGLGAFGAAHHLAIGDESGGYSFELGDLDGDGRPDLVAGHPTGEPGAGPSFDCFTVLLGDPGPRADLAVSLAASSAEVHVAEPLDWTITVANHGPDPASSVAVRDVLRLGASWISAIPSQGSCTQGDGVVGCALGAMASGASATVTVRVSPTAVGTLWNGASARSGTPDPDGTDDGASATATVVAASADLALDALDAPDPVTVGESLAYTLTATNGGPSAATGVTLVDPLPVGVALVSAVPSAGSCSSASGIVTCALGGLAPGGQATVTIVVTPSTSGNLANTATVSAAEADPVAANDTAALHTTVRASGGESKKGGCGCGSPDGAEAMLSVVLLALWVPVGRGRHAGRG